jgi:hypothetical protein
MKLLLLTTTTRKVPFPCSRYTPDEYDNSLLDASGETI